MVCVLPASSVRASAASDRMCRRGPLPTTILADTFELRRPARPELSGSVTVGIEIEVPFSSYFPVLWRKWGLAGRRVADLPAGELLAFSAECALQEVPLRRRLEATVACGIPRGNDRYWEFSPGPVADLGLLWEQVHLLAAAGVLPRDRRHALHVTLGGLRRTSDVYYLAMALELLYVERERICAGVAATREAIFTGWGRKGLSGVFEKGSGDLMGGEQVACEIRTLQLPLTDCEFEQMLRLVRVGADAVAARQAGQKSEGTEWLATFRSAAEAALARRGLPASNWWHGGKAGGIDYEAWAGFARHHDALREELDGLLYFESHASLTPQQDGEPGPSRSRPAQ